MQDTVITPSEFVALVNQTLEFAMPIIKIEGEVSSFTVSKSKWVYFNLKDDESTVKFFGSVYQLKQPIEDGMKVVVTGSPRLHNQYGFSVNVQAITPSGEGALKRAFELLKQKLDKEGLFDESRKRPLPVFPKTIGLIASTESAAYADFIKLLNHRWGGVEIKVFNVNVQGEQSPGHVVKAIEYFNQTSEPVDVLVLTRGGGSIEDLQAFNTEEVARAVAGSRTPIVVGVGHEIDTSLADLAADVRATTPTNAAQLIVPDRNDIIAQINTQVSNLGNQLMSEVDHAQTKTNHAVEVIGRQLNRPRQKLDNMISSLNHAIGSRLDLTRVALEGASGKLIAYNPRSVLKRGYNIARLAQGKSITSANQLQTGDKIMLEFHQGKAKAEVTDVEK